MAGAFSPDRRAREKLPRNKVTPILSLRNFIETFRLP
jgi:hypothetical protein